jgi:hypothetical protein
MSTQSGKERQRGANSSQPSAVSQIFTATDVKGEFDSACFSESFPLRPSRTLR